MATNYSTNKKRKMETVETVLTHTPKTTTSLTNSSVDQLFGNLFVQYERLVMIADLHKQAGLRVADLNNTSLQPCTNSATRSIDTIDTLARLMMDKKLVEFDEMVNAIALETTGCDDDNPEAQNPKKRCLLPDAIGAVCNVDHLGTNDDCHDLYDYDDAEIEQNVESYDTFELIDAPIPDLCQNHEHDTDPNYKYEPVPRHTTSRSLFFQTLSPQVAAGDGEDQFNSLAIMERSKYDREALRINRMLSIEL
tara:strand:+ start:263 stop:1015 length:753 start_codon:yes stop_codon:yes gene_type:complete